MSSKIKESYIEVYKSQIANSPLWTLPPADADLLLQRLVISVNNNTVQYCNKNNIECSLNNPRFCSELSLRHNKILNVICKEDFTKRLFDNSLDIKNISDYAIGDLNPSAVAAELGEIDSRMAQKIEISFAKTERCRKCKGSKVTRIATAGRSLGSDEINGFRFDCLECGANWSI